MPSTPASTARCASAGPSGPFSTSGPRHRARNDSMTGQSSAGLNCEIVSSIVCSGKLAKEIAVERSIRVQ